MTDIFIFKRKDLYLGFETNGHAEAGDVLCASLSLLSINTCNSIEKICCLNEKDINLEIEDGYLKIFIDVNRLKEEQLVCVQTLIKSFEIGVISLKEEYNKYIEIYYKEV